MIGWRARLGFLVPPGNPTVEPEMIALAPKGVSVHFHRMTARGATGSLEGQDERNRMMVDNIDESIELLAMVESRCHRRGAYRDQLSLGRQGEADLLGRLRKIDRQARGHGLRLGVARVGAAQCAPAGARHALFDGNDIAGQSASRSARPGGRQFRQSAGRHQHLRRNRRAGLSAGAAWSTEKTPKPSFSAAPACRHCRYWSCSKQDLGKPVISSASAMMWCACGSPACASRLPAMGG